MLQLRRRCPKDWVDFNGHMRDAYYVLLISFANDQMMDELGMGPVYLQEKGCTLYNLDNRTQYRREAVVGDPLRVEMRLVDADSKRLHLHSEIFLEGSNALLAVNEAVLIHIQKQDGPKSEPFPENVRALVRARLEQDSVGPKSKHLVGEVGIKRK